MGSGVSHGASEKEAGKLESFGDLSEVNTNAAIECLLEKLRVSPVLCLSHRDLSCPVNPVLPLRIQHNISYHASGNTCLLDFAVFLLSNASSLWFPQWVFNENCSFNHAFISEKTPRALALSSVEPNLHTHSHGATASHGSSSACTKLYPNSHLPASYTAVHLTCCQSPSLTCSPLKSAEIADDNPPMEQLSTPKSALLVCHLLMLPDPEFTDVQCDGTHLIEMYISLHFFSITITE